MAYEHFYKYYDFLMSDVNYEEWIQIVKQYFSREHQLLELACGTGTILTELLENDFKVDGLDMSEEMLTIAKEKLSQKKLNTNLYLGDMRELHLKANYDGVICFLDSINYLSTKDDLLKTFNGINQILKPNSYFIFDTHSIHKLITKMNGYSYNESFNEFTYLWNCYVEEFNEYATLDHELTFFIKRKRENNLYERMDEVHKQTVFILNVYKNLLQKSGFTIIEILFDFKNSIDSKQSDRIMFVTKKCK